jgi:ribosomal protein L28
MASTCILCNKGTQVAGGYSNRVRATKFTPTGARRRYPNLQWAQIPGGPRIKVCTRCIKAKKHLEIEVVTA